MISAAQEKQKTAAKDLLKSSPKQQEKSKTISKNLLNLQSSLKQLKPKNEDQNTEAQSSRNRSPRSKRKTRRKKGNNKHITIGPLQVTLVDINDRYRKGVAVAVCRCLVHCMVGAVNIIVLGYTIKTGDAHAILCTLAWHFFATEAMLVVTYTGILTQDHKKYSHMILQICGLVLLLTGSILIFLKVNKSAFSAHCIVGTIGMAMTIITIMSGPFMLQRKNRSVRLFHTCLALPTYLITSVCLILALLKPKLQAYAGAAIVYVLIVFVAFYTIFIIVIVSLRAWNRSKANRLFLI
ncbi:eukaryotic cytochrome b561 domain-containing protein [Phthorimaea operculella]|nr:eukaryotic cytochrome b561 domain-containing protein [Phthorimaea operculella]